MQHVTDCHVEPLTGRVPEREREGAEVGYLALAGLGCPNCANRVRNALLRATGVVDVEVDLTSALATVWYRPDEGRVWDFVNAVSVAGLGTHHRYLAVPVEAL